MPISGVKLTGLGMCEMLFHPKDTTHNSHSFHSTLHLTPYVFTFFVLLFLHISSLFLLFIIHQMLSIFILYTGISSEFSLLFEESEPGGNTWRANATQKGIGPESNPGPSYCETTVLHIRSLFVSSVFLFFFHFWQILTPDIISLSA